MNKFEFGLFFKPKSPKRAEIWDNLFSRNSPNDIDQTQGQSICATLKQDEFKKHINEVHGRLVKKAVNQNNLFYNVL